MDQTCQRDIRVVNFRKAFEQEPHRHLLKKLEASGVRGNVHEWPGHTTHMSHTANGSGMKYATGGTRTIWRTPRLSTRATRVLDLHK